MKKSAEETIYDIFRDREIYPDVSYTAAAGRDYGYVAGWELPDGTYLIVYGDSTTTDLAITDDISDLAIWLDPPDLSALDAILSTANVRGVDSLTDASDKDDGPFYVLKTRYYYDQVGITSFIDEGNNSGVPSPRKFDSYSSASEWIEGIFCLNNNEIATPTYTIVSATYTIVSAASAPQPQLA